MLILSLVSCQKFYDKWNHGQYPAGICNIEKMIMEDDQNGAVSYADFFYNNKGLPDSIIYTYDPIDLSKAYSNFHFWYDNKNRLTKYTSSNIVNTYAYAGNNKLPVSVTIDDPNLDRVTQKTFTFDSKGRVSFYVDSVLETSDPDLNVVSYTHPVYDAAGNLIREEISWRQVNTGETGSDVATYPRTDTKSIYITNKIWQLITLDWSINSMEAAVSVSSKGLPRKFTSSYFYIGGGRPLTISYSCD
jgi:hypothetical protein